ncbi:MAG: hypothetical protein K2G77_01375 [Muribaculaceae bacterium]|nr:hypothetical protein [Muribaculaceae bacterium]
MDYIEELHRIEQEFSLLDDKSYNTIEEANRCLIKYDELLDHLVLIIKQALNDGGCSISLKDRIVKKASELLGSHIGSADDMKKYGDSFDDFHIKGLITYNQLHYFRDNLDIGRWR